MNIKLAYKKNLSRTNRNLIYAGLSFLLAWSFFIAGSRLGWLYISIGAFLGFNALNYYWAYKKNVRKLWAVQEKQIEKRAAIKDKDIWEFNEGFFRYKDFYYDYSIKWEAFAGYRIIQRNLFIMMSESIGFAFILGENEIGTENFTKLTQWLGQRLSYITDEKK